MQFSSLTLFAALTSIISARPQAEKRDVVYVTNQATVTEQQVITQHETAYITAAAAVAAAQQTGSAGSSTVQQVQVIVYEIAAQYTYSSARTVFAVPTTLTTTITQTALITPTISNGVTITPAASTTLTTSLAAGTAPTGMATPSAVTATLPLVSVRIAGATVTVSAQPITYYTPVVATIAAASTTAVAALSTTAIDAGNIYTSQTTLATKASTATAIAGQTTTATGSLADSTQAAFISTVLNSINGYRSQHNAPALTWDNTLAAGALAYAQTCVMEHSANSSLGETLAAGTTTDPTFYIDLWYNENMSYNYAAPGFSDATGHFTQLVWASTSKVGCGFASGCGQYSNYLVCRYSTPGNVVGGTNNVQYFIENVFA